MPALPKPVKKQKGNQLALILIEVSGGVAEVTGEQGNVETCLVDWDNIKSGEEAPYNWEKFAHLRPDLKKDIEDALKAQEEQ